MFCERATAADTFARLESQSQSLILLNQILHNFPDLPDLLLDNQDSFNSATIVGSAARRSVEALHCIFGNIEGMGYVAGSGILEEKIAGAIDQLEDIGKAHEFLETVISDIEEDADQSREAAFYREQTIGAVERGHDLDDDMHVPIETIEGTSAQNWCEEFASDTVDTILSSVGVLDDPAETAEHLNIADRALLTNEVLQRSVALVILGHDHMITGTAYERLADAASRAREVLEDALLGLADNQDEDLDPAMEACAELLDAARQAVAFCTAQAALEGCLTAFVNQ